MHKPRSVLLLYKTLDIQSDNKTGEGKRNDSILKYLALTYDMLIKETPKLVKTLL